MPLITEDPHVRYRLEVPILVLRKRNCTLEKEKRERQGGRGDGKQQDWLSTHDQRSFTLAALLICAGFARYQVMSQAHPFHTVPACLHSSIPTVLLVLRQPRSIVMCKSEFTNSHFVHTFMPVHTHRPAGAAPSPLAHELPHHLQRGAHCRSNEAPRRCPCHWPQHLLGVWGEGG